MKPVDQTLFGGEVGNCFAACIASLLELPLESVPNFCAHSHGGTAWFDGFVSWLKERGFTAIAFGGDLGEAFGHMTAGYYIATGPASRGFLHATIQRGGELVHDPHPSREGLLSVYEYLWLVPIDPMSAFRSGAQP